MQANTTFLALNAVPTVAASTMYLSPFRHAASRCSGGTGVLSRQAEILPSSVSQPWPWRHFRQNVKYAPCPMWWVRSRSVMSLADVRIVQAISRSSPPRAPKRRPGRTSSFWRRSARQPAKVRARNWSAPVNRFDNINMNRAQIASSRLSVASAGATPGQVRRDFGQLRDSIGRCDRCLGFRR